jgi:hypothetical protein
VRKRLVALLSLVGLANSASPAVTQVLKGSSQPPDTKTESKVKLDKSQQENAATKNDSTVKLTKSVGEQKAGQDVVSEKVGADHIAHKHIAGVKYEKQTTESDTGKTKIQPEYTRHKKNKADADAASKDAAKLTKATNENTAIQDAQNKKVKTVAGESTALKTDAGKKVHKTGNEQTDALTVKQKVVENSVGAGKTQATIKLHKADAASKDASKLNTGQQNVEKATDKATPK